MAIPANKEENAKAYDLNLSLLEEKVIRLVEMVKVLKEENNSLTVQLQEQEDEAKAKVAYAQELEAKNEKLEKQYRELEAQLKKAETSLVDETRDLEELSQEKVMTKMVVDDLISSIDSLVEYKK